MLHEWGHRDDAVRVCCCVKDGMGGAELLIGSWPLASVDERLCELAPS